MSCPVCLHRLCSLAAVTVPALRSASLCYAESQNNRCLSSKSSNIKDWLRPAPQRHRNGCVVVDPWPGHDVAECAWVHTVGDVKSRKTKTQIGDFSGEGGLCDHLCGSPALSSSSSLLSQCSLLSALPCLRNCHKASARHLPAANPVLPLYPSVYQLVFFSASELCWHDQQLAKLRNCL